MAEHEKTSHKNRDRVDQTHSHRQKESYQSEHYRDWDENQLSIGETPFWPQIEHHRELLTMAQSDNQKANVTLQLQHNYGNRYVQRLVDYIQNKDHLESINNGRYITLVSPKSITLIQEFGERPHEEIEEEALGNLYKKSERMQIALGNWQNDFNQISLINPVLKDTFGKELTDDDLFEIATIIAETKFGEKIAKQMDKHRFGSYKETQHFDNPLKADAELGMEAVPKYIKGTIKEIKATFQKAVNAGNNAIGREYYGSALHIMEDYFAHSNFVEIALRLRGVFVVTQAGVVESGQDKGRYRLASGVFETLDTVVSMLKILMDHMQKPPEPGQAIGSGDKITLVFLRRYKPNWAKAYKLWLYANAWAKKRIPGYKKLQQIAQSAKSWVSLKMAALIGMLASLLETQTGKGPQPSHSKLNKDDPSRPLYGIAKELAVHVVKEMNPKMVGAWEDPKDPNKKKELFKSIDEFTKHPDSCSWWYPIVDKHKSKREGKE